MGNIIPLLIKTLFDLYLLVLWLRLLLQLCKASPQNPLVKRILQLTRPLVVPFQKWLPPIGRLNTCVVLWLLVIKTVELFVLYWLAGVTSPSVFGVLIFGCGELLQQVLTIYFFALILQAVFSWIQPQRTNPVIEPLEQLTTPLLAPIQRLIPPLGGIDFSALFAIIAIQVVKMLVLSPLISLGARIMSPG